MDVLPLHVGLQKAALTAIMIVAPFVTHVSSMLWAQLDDESHLLLFALDFLLIGSTLFLLVHATTRRSTSIHIAALTGAATADPNGCSRLVTIPLPGAGPRTLGMSRLSGGRTSAHVIWSPRLLRR